MPEAVAGLATSQDEFTLAIEKMVVGGFTVIIPELISRDDDASGNAALNKWTNQSHREWIYRQSFQMGRHIIGFEVQKIQALVDRLEPFDRERIGIAGQGEGGLLALYAAAADPRLRACYVRGYFAPREGLHGEPIYRNVFGLLREFGDAEIASLIAPRALFVDSQPCLAVPHLNPDTPERLGAAAGILPSVTPELAEQELTRARNFTSEGLGSFHLVSAADSAALAWPFQFLTCLNMDGMFVNNGHRLKWGEVKPPAENTKQRQVAQVKELERYVQRLVEDSERVRQDRFLGSIPVIQEIEKSRHFTMHKMDERPAERFTSETPKFRQEFWENVLGKLPDPSEPPNPRTRVAHENPKWTGYDVVLDVWPGVFAWGELLVPKDLKLGEKRPVVVCQHGRNGLPADTVAGDKEAYNNFAAVLAEQGFITFAPHNLYRGEDKYRFIQRKANSIGASMFSVIVAQHQQCLAWLKTLPFVDPQRIAFYGLSYGGESAVRIPAVLPDYCLSICSGDFNDWTRKVASTRDAHSFMFSKEWEMPYWNMGNTFSYAELSYLIFPRPFMVERGHHDMVAPDAWVASEYAKTRYVYDQFGRGDRTAIEFFNGGHTIHGVGTFEFLHRQLHWP